MSEIVRTCPTCGFPNESPFGLPRDITYKNSQWDLHDLRCHVCGSVHKRWVWRKTELDGEFEWPKAMELIR